MTTRHIALFAHGSWKDIPSDLLRFSAARKNWVIDIGNLHNPHLVILVATFPILVKPVPETEFI